MKIYTEQEKKEVSVKEPTMEYMTSSLIQDVELLSDEILIGAIKYADIARSSNRMISHDQVSNLLCEKLGWE